MCLCSIKLFRFGISHINNVAACDGDAADDDAAAVVVVATTANVNVLLPFSF